MARLLPVKGAPREIRPANKSYFTLEEIQQHISAGLDALGDVDPNLEVVPGFRYEDGMLFCNSNDLQARLPFNMTASILTSRIVHGDTMLVADSEWS